MVLEITIKGFNMKKIVLATLLTTAITFALSLGETPKNVILSGENGSLVSGEDWNSAMLKEKVHLLLYVDPDKKSDTEKFIDTLEAKGYNSEQFKLVAIINLKATWLPNVMIEKKLKEQQKKLPNTLYVKDKTKFLVKEWGLADDSSNIIIFDKEGKVIYTHVGALNDKEMQTIFTLLEEKM